MGRYPGWALSRHTGRAVRRGTVGWLAFQLLAAPAQAEDPGDLESPIDIHGFVSQGAIKTSDNDYLGQSERGSLEFTEVGLNFTKSFGPDLRVGFQLFARDIGPLGNYQPQFDWYYLDYRFADWFGVRAGRTKLPFGLYNENSDIDAARVPVLLPQSLYPLRNREVLLAQTGAELYGRLPLGALGALEYRLYGGTIFLDTSNASPQLSSFNVPYIVGGRLMWQPIDGLSFGGSVQKLRFDFDYTPTAAQIEAYTEQGVLPPDFDGRIWAKIPAWLWIGSIEYLVGEWQFAVEYGRSHFEAQTSLLSPTIHSKNQGYYAMASYRVRPWFSPGVYYSVLRSDFENRTGISEFQHDVAISARFDINPHWLVKLEAHAMYGTAGLDPALNDVADAKGLNDLEPNWAVFVAKTTAYF